MARKAPAKKKTKRPRRTARGDTSRPRNDPSTHTGHVLVVDDEVNHLFVMRSCLKRRGYQVTTCSDARKVIGLIEEHRPDLVVLDARMPHINGIKLCRQVRQRWDPGQLPVIVLSALSSEDHIIDGYEAGANDYLEKPIAADALIAKVAIHLRKRDIRRLLLLAARGLDSEPKRTDGWDSPKDVDIGPYRIESFIGAGTSGFVFQARRRAAEPGGTRQPRRRVALKVLTLPHLHDPGFLARFQREADMVASIRHRNVVGLYEAGQHLGYYYYAMRHVDGQSLRETILDDGPLSNDALRSVAADMARALSAIHRRSIIHRDVKPGNIILDRQTGRAMLGDFGLARPVDSPILTERGFLVGTASYMAPERILGEGRIDIRSDLYSLGATLFHAATGQPPFGLDQTIPVLIRHLAGKPPSVRSKNRKVSKALGDVITRLLSRDPEDRFRTPRGLLLAL